VGGRERGGRRQAASMVTQKSGKTPTAVKQKGKQFGKQHVSLTAAKEGQKNQKGREMRGKPMNSLFIPYPKPTGRKKRIQKKYNGRGENCTTGRQEKKQKRGKAVIPKP